MGLALTLCVLVMSSRPALADSWYEHYARAEHDLRQERWAEAVAELNQAIEKRGDSSARARTYGMKVTPYFPYLKLGVAYHHLGKLDAALQAFDTEERLGEIASSEADLAELARYRTLTHDAKRALAAEAQKRIRDIVRRSLEQATELSRQDRLEDALEALGQALAVAPEDPGLKGALARLQERIAERQRRQEVDQRAASLVAEGQRLLQAQAWEEAASIFRQALSLKQDRHVEALLGQAQAALRKRLAAERVSTEHQAQIGRDLERARRFADGGDEAAALAALQSVLALDESNGEALELQSRLIVRARQEQEARALREMVDRQLAEAERAFAAGEPERALALANRTLAIDASADAARDIVRRAYTHINRQLLGVALAENLPPAISFIDARVELDDGSRVQIVDRGQFHLSGLVLDESPVEVSSAVGEDRAPSVESRPEQRGQHYLTHFRIDLELTPGPTEIQLAATDVDGLSSASTYQVLYRRPFIRTPQFLAAVALVVLSPVALVYWRRRLRRRSLLRRRFNPYVAGAPVFDDALFFGRDELLERVLQALPNNSILLYGERRIGKTSLQHRLQRRLLSLDDPDYEFFPVYIDLQGTPQEQFFATIADEVIGEFRPLLDGFDGREPLAEDGYGYPSLVRDLRTVLRALAARSPKRVRLVLQIDEVDELNDYDPRVNQRLRSLFMKSFAENLVAVVSGVQIKRHWDREGSPWYNFFEEIEVLPLPADAARQLVERPLRGAFDLEPGLVDRVVELTGGRPYLIQKLCMVLVNRAHDSARTRIALADLEAVGLPEESCAMLAATAPFVVGNWVRGERFYGRREQIGEILSGHRRALWLLGTRRSGKTSVLKQLELLAQHRQDLGLFPLFWDFQGAEDGGGLNETWSDALLDAEERLEDLDIDLDQLQVDDLFASMGRLRRQLRSRDLRLFALCDEVEELIRLQQHDPKLVRKLRRALQTPDDVHSVLASSIRLWVLSETHEDTSPFLHGYTPPLYLHRLSDDAARALVRQDQLPESCRPVLGDGVVEEILQRCDNHPYLLQLLAKRTVECGDLGEACERVAWDQMVRHFFAVDLEMLSDTERRILISISERSTASSRSLLDELSEEASDGEVQSCLFRLESLGYLRRDREQRYALASFFFRRWLRELQAAAGGRPIASAPRSPELTLGLPGVPPAPGPAAGRIAGRYRLLERVSEGAHGIVYRARDELIGTEIAIKVLKSELVSSNRAIERLRQEILLSRDLSHPNILRTYDLGTWREQVYLTMQWVEGPSLRRVIRELAPLPTPTVTSIGRRLASALEAAHARHILHRDLKPANVLMQHGHEPLVADFGLARVIGEPGVTRSDMFVGTPKYASPEQANQSELDERSDIYNLGLILFEMATGRAPFEADTAVGVLLQHSQSPAPDPRELEPGVPEALATIILRCLEKRPEDRFPTARALAEALQKV